MIKRLFILILLAALIASLFTFTPEVTVPAAAEFSLMSVKQSTPAQFQGTFIQWWLFKDWDPERWQAEFAALIEAGINYVVILPTAYYINEYKTTYTIYPTDIKGFEQISGLEYDSLDLCLKTAQDFGIKIFVGLNFSDSWWNNRTNNEWILQRMQEGNILADELWGKYRAKYPESFYGWYWVWEIDNFYFRTLFDFGRSKNLLSDAISVHMKHFEENNMRLPFMLAPYMDSALGSARGYARLWEYVFANSGMRSGDIFCPQDSVGAGGLNERNVSDWFDHLRRAVDTLPGLQLWGDIETFEIKNWESVTLDRVTSRMERLSPFADAFISFSYSHYYSPYEKNPGYHTTYLDYLKNGSLENEAPEIPCDISAELSESSVTLKWKASYDNIGVHSYDIYRNGIKIDSRIISKEMNENLIDKLPQYITFTDKFYPANEVIQYNVEAIDFAGNRSGLSLPTFIRIH